MRTSSRLLITIVTATGLAVPLATPAAADPRGGETFMLECDDGSTYEVITAPGNGEWTPAFDAASNTVLIPIAFGDFTFTVTFDDGTSETFTEEGESRKGSVGRSPRQVVTCDFSETVSAEEDPTILEEFPGAESFTLGGTVQGFVTPARR